MLKDLPSVEIQNIPNDFVLKKFLFELFIAITMKDQDCSKKYLKTNERNYLVKDFKKIQCFFLVTGSSIFNNNLLYSFLFPIFNCNRFFKGILFHLKCHIDHLNISGHESIVFGHIYNINL